jgi:hypothetical protein
MAKLKLTGSEEVTHFMAALEHPFKAEIEQMRQIILAANKDLTENIKWNAPSFCLNGDDRITMRINPPKQLQLIFHRGAKVLDMPKEALIKDNSGILSWKTNDRAVATFLNRTDIEAKSEALVLIINDWLKAAATEI